MSSCPNQFDCIKCNKTVNLAQIGGGQLNCPHCHEYLLDSITAATTEALHRAKAAGTHTDLVPMEKDVVMEGQTIPGFTAAKHADPPPGSFGSGSQASGSQAWAKSGGMPNTAHAAAQPLSPPKQSDAIRQAAAPY